ncbi:MAG: hypothetical protein LBM93_15015 [Oscillospiraceae bacterium]|nr:hypothetical protein [Oscillospiraceae bacterium]
MLGYTLEQTKQIFEKGRSEHLQYLKESSKDEYDDYLVQFTYENWSNAVQKYARVLSQDIYDYPNFRYDEIQKYKNNPNNSYSEKKVLSTLPFTTAEYFAFPYDYEDTDLWNVFRVILEAFENSQEVVLNYSDLYYGECCKEYPEEDDFCDDKTIVLTEGSYDVEVLSKSMDLLYPYMSKFYSFIDFSFNLDGGTSYLSKYTKLFAAAGIKNRVIALFDNDTAGTLAMNDLLSETKRNKSFPDNFRILSLPYNSDVEHWATLGHTGETEFNVNGLACSIEMYLGKDVLFDDANKPYPVRFTTYIEKAEKYQGKVVKKDEIQKRFALKLKNAKENGIADISSWKQLDKVLNAIFKAFT